MSSPGFTRSNNEWLTGSELAPHQLGLGSLSAVKQPALPLCPQHQSRGAAVRRRVGRAGPEESHVHGHFHKSYKKTAQDPAHTKATCSAARKQSHEDDERKATVRRSGQVGFLFFLLGLV